MSTEREATLCAKAFTERGNEVLYSFHLRHGPLATIFVKALARQSIELAAMERFLPERLVDRMLSEGKKAQADLIYQFCALQEGLTMAQREALAEAMGYCHDALLKQFFTVLDERGHE